MAINGDDLVKRGLETFAQMQSESERLRVLSDGLQRDCEIKQHTIDYLERDLAHVKAERDHYMTQVAKFMEAASTISGLALDLAEYTGKKAKEAVLAPYHPEEMPAVVRQGPAEQERIEHRPEGQ